MKVGRHLLGRVVEIRWMDPNSARGPLSTLLKGRQALATWREYGVIHDITDGVVLIAHSYAAEASQEEPNEIERTAIPEVLIEKITLYEEKVEGSPERERTLS